MKKVLIVILAIIGLASCTKSDVINTAPKNAITFDDAFINNSTKAAYDGSYKTDNLGGFQVYATITGVEAGEGTANIFNAEQVVRGSSLGCGTDWSYSSGNTQYWVPGNKYSFRAIADGNIANVSEVVAAEEDKFMPKAINLLDASAQKDILFAEQLDIMYNQGDGAKTVEFTFSHIMAKAKFTIKNAITIDSGYSYMVSNIRLLEVARNGVYTFGGNGAGAWSPATSPATYTLEFGNAVQTGTPEGAETADIKFGEGVESNYDRLLIPTNGHLKIMFDYKLLKDGVVIDTHKDYEVLTASRVTLESGHAYNLIIRMENPGDPIRFSVEKVESWEE